VFGFVEFAALRHIGLEHESWDAWTLESFKKDMPESHLPTFSIFSLPNHQLFAFSL
jgi:hypothetical protein